jgi:hypothetical protein
MGGEKEANRILRALSESEITEVQARDQLIALGVNPAHAEEMIAIEHGEGDIREI